MTVDYPVDHLVEHPAPTDGAITMPAMIGWADSIDAFAPILALVGLEPMSVMAEGFKVTHDAVECISAIPVTGVKPVAVGEDSEFSVWGWPVRVEIRVP